MKRMTIQMRDALNRRSSCMPLQPSPCWLFSDYLWPASEQMLEYGVMLIPIGEQDAVIHAAYCERCQGWWPEDVRKHECKEPSHG